MDFIEYMIFFCGAMAGFLAISLPLVAFTDWLQKKLDEFNEQQDNLQSNNQQQ